MCTVAKGYWAVCGLGFLLLPPFSSFSFWQKVIGLFVGWVFFSFHLSLLFLPPGSMHILVSWLGGLTSPYARLGDWKGVSRHTLIYRIKNVGREDGKMQI
jgi:hypothetical protein